MLLNEVHALAVQFFDRLPDGFVLKVLESMGKLEPAAPVTEVRGDHKKGLLVQEILREYLPIGCVGLWLQIPHHQRDELDWLSLEDLSDVRNVHLERMLVLLILLIYLLKQVLPGAKQLLDRYLIDLHVSQRRRPFTAEGRCDKIEPDLMGRSQQKNPLVFGCL